MGIKNNDKEEAFKRAWKKFFDTIGFTKKVLEQRLQLDNPNQDRLEKDYYIFLVKKLLSTASKYGFNIDINEAMAYLEYKYNELKNGNKKTDD